MIPNSTDKPFDHLLENWNETASMCRVREGKLGCEIMPVYYVGQWKRTDHVRKKAGIKREYLAVQKMFYGTQRAQRAEDIFVMHV